MSWMHFKLSLMSILWAVGTLPTAAAPVGVPTNRRQFECTQ